MKSFQVIIRWLTHAVEGMQNPPDRDTLPRRPPTNALQPTLQIPYVYYYVTKICKKQVEVRNIGIKEAKHRKYKNLKIGGGQAYERSGV
jgi:hypothetical protein